MSKQNGKREARRQNLRASLQRDRNGGFSTHFAKMMVKPFDGKPAECTLTGHCRTFIFEFPRSEVIAEEPVQHKNIFDEDGMKAAIVCDLPAYFEKKPADSLHFEVDISLRAAVHSTHEKSLEQSERTAKSLFLVIEEIAEFSPTVMSSEQCFTIDAVRDGEAIIEGARKGERALLALPALGCPWPDFQPDMYRVNVILAAVKAIQNAIGHITQHYECACFMSSKREAVYTLNPTMSASAVVGSRLSPEELEETASRIGSMLQGMMSDPDPVATELFDSIVLDKTNDDGYLRLWYLRLWQAVVDAKKHLGQPGLLNKRDVIAGERAPTKLKAYRNSVAHWHTGRIDHSYLSDLQHMTMELLRRKYGSNPDPNR